MAQKERMAISLLDPEGRREGLKVLSETTIHDLGLDVLCKNVAQSETERSILLRVLSGMTDEPAVTRYRCEIFTDLYEQPALCERLMKLLGKIDFLRDYGSFRERLDDHAGAWDVLHRLEDINDYIGYVEAIHQCLADATLNSRGLTNLKEHVAALYRDHGFDELKKDVAACRATTSTLKSVTLGINLNERFEASGIGLISINSKPFVKSGILGNFSDKLLRGGIRADNEWDGSYHVHPFTTSGGPNAMEQMVQMRARMNPMTSSIASVPADDSAESVPYHMEKVANHLLELVVKRVREVLQKYVYVTITDITDLIPEMIFYIRFIEYFRGLKEKGFRFCTPRVSEEDRIMRAKGLWNLKLTELKPEETVPNDLSFDREHRVYILTGANRGGKTTVTQAVGQLFVLAQAGLSVPAEEFVFSPADQVCTHFPADEDKTLDLGRLGEECQRFRELYRSCTKTSLLLLNETFSTTSFEEGYYIARDSVRAILSAGIRTVYNTHMHKLAFELNDINSPEADGQAASLIVRAEDGKRSFRVAVAPPEGMSYARDIAEKYGVTYETLRAEKTAATGKSSV